MSAPSDLRPTVFPAAPGSRERPPVRIFLGTEPAQARAERVFVFALGRVRDPARRYEVYRMSRLAGFDERGWRTGFTNYRFAIPDLAGREGRAIYNDVDQVWLADPAPLFDADLGGHGYLALVADDTAVMLIDCARMADVWNLEAARRQTKKALHARAAAEPGRFGALDPAWHARDLEFEPGVSKLLHYTTLHLQPWRPTPDRYTYQIHPYGEYFLSLERAADEAERRSGAGETVEAAAGSGSAIGAADRGSAAAPPTVWVLLGRHGGDNAQILAIADALGWPYATKDARFGRAAFRLNAALGGRLSARTVDGLEPPWPGLVLGCGRRSAPVARWIRAEAARAGVRTRIVQVGRTRSPLSRFDLVVTTPQYGLPLEANVVGLPAPFIVPRPAPPEAELDAWRRRWAGLPRPWVALLVGGNAKPYRLDAETAVHLGRDAAAAAGARGGSLLVATSPRTSTAATEALFAALAATATPADPADAAVPHRAYRFGAGDADGNPYPALLAMADAFVVSGDSVSMLTEACLTGRPVAVYPLPVERRGKAKLRHAIERWAGVVGRGAGIRGTEKQQNWRGRLYLAAVGAGLRRRERQFALQHAALGVRPLPDGLDRPPGLSPEWLAASRERALAAIRSLVADRRSSGAAAGRSTSTPLKPTPIHARPD